MRTTDTTLFPRKSMLKTLSLSLFLLLSTALWADPPPPPPPGGHGSASNGPPVGAPIDGGLGILLVMGAAYGGRKIYMERKKTNKTNQDQKE